MDSPLLRMHATTAGFSAEGRGFYTWDEDRRTLELWKRELDRAAQLDADAARTSGAGPHEGR